MTGRGRTRSYGQDACETTANASERPRTYCSALQAANHWLALASIGGRVERAMGIEPTAQAWEAWVLPLYDARASWILCASPRSAQILRPGRWPAPQDSKTSGPVTCGAGGRPAPIS